MTNIKALSNLAFFSIALSLLSYGQEISTKGALIIASVEGDVTVVNNQTNQPVDSGEIVAGGVIYDGHTVKTGPASKMILLLTNGTVATIKAETSMNIKKFTQEKFDMSKTDFNELKGEPSKSNTVIDIEIGDLVVDVKRLDKDSSFNIESPVGTAGIRGTVPAISVMQMPDGGFQQNTSMLRGEIAFTPRGGGLPTLLGPGQSLASGIGPNGVMLPMQLGQVSAAMMSAIQADVEAAGEAMGISVEGGPDASDANAPNPEEEAPSEDELNDSDDERKGASKGVGDDDNGTDAVALEKAGLIDLDDPEQASKADSFIEVATSSASSFEEKAQKEAEVAQKQAEVAQKQSEVDADKAMLEELKLQRNSRRNADDQELSVEERIAELELRIIAAEIEIASSQEEIATTQADIGKDTSSFVESLSENIGDVVDVTIEMEELGIKDPDLIEKTAENAENAPITKQNVEKAKEVGVEDTEALAGFVANPDKSDEAAEILADAEALGAADPETFSALGRSVDVADKMVEAKQSGTDVDSVLVAVKTTDSKKQVAKQKKVEAQKKKEEALASGVEIPNELIASIDSATDEASLTALLEENAGEAYYDQLVILKESRSDILSAELETQAADTAKTKIVDTSGYIGKVKKLATEKKAKAEETKKGLSEEVINRVEATVTIDYTDEEVDALLSEFANDPNIEAITDLVNNLKTSYDLDPTKLADGIIDNADSAADNLETMQTAESLGVDPSTIAKQPERAKEYKEITTQVSDDLASGDVGADLFVNIDTVADIVSVAKEKGLETSDITKNVAKDAAVASEMKEFVDQIDDSAAPADASTAFASIADAGKIIKKAKESGVASEDIAKTLVAEADVIVEMKEFVDQIDDSAAPADASTAFAGIADAGNILKEAKKNSDLSADDVAKNLVANADVIAEMREFVEQIDDSVAPEDASTAFASISDAGKILKKAKEDGGSTENLAKNLASNAEIISSAKEAVDQLDEGADATSLFTNIVDVGGAVKKAKDLGVTDTALIKEMATNPDKASKVNEVFATVGENIDADGAKNILGNVENVEDTLTALSYAQESGADLNEFVKKDVAEHQALNEVIDQFKSAGGEDAAQKFLEEGIDDALQYKQAFDEGHVDAETLASTVSGGGTFDDAFKSSSLTKLNERFAGNADFQEALSLYEDKSKDILFALSFVQPGSPEEVALMGNLDKLDAIMHLSHKFEENPERMTTIFANLDVAIALDQLVAELGVFPERLDVIFQNADLAPSVLATYLEYEKLGSFDLIDSMFSTSENLIDSVSNVGLNNLLRDYPNYISEIEANSQRAGEISGLISQVGQQNAGRILENLDRFDEINSMVLRSKGDITKIDVLMDHLHILSPVKELSDQYKQANLLGGQDVIFSSLSLFDRDPQYLEIASSSPKFFVRLSEIVGDLNQVPSSLAFQLKDLDLARTELTIVMNDLLAGPQVEGPSTAPPMEVIDQGNADLATLSFLTDHYIPSADDQTIDNVVFLNPNKVVDSSIAYQSTLFEESVDLYYELSNLESGSSLFDSGMSDIQDDGYFIGGVLGGRNIEFNAANYDLSNLSSSSLLVAASGTLSLNGDLSFSSSSSKYGLSELFFISIERLSISEGSTISFSGESLGFGSLDSIDLLNVDLHAEGEISLRSLDSLVINNADMSTSGNGGADFVHLLAASELSIDRLHFSEQVRQIAMEAMTINLSNLNFPAGSSVQLNSLYGGVDGIYPNFGGKQYGRVNFIQNVRYNTILIDSRTAFDDHGGNITIGSTR